MAKIVGIPCALFYHKYRGLWKSFFDLLQVETVESGETSGRILDLGLKYCVNEACLPVKAYYGHAAELKDKADYLFIPRYVSIYKREYVCPKFNALPDMIKSSIPGLPEIIDAEINLRNGKITFQDAACKIADTLKIDRKIARSAYALAEKEYLKSLKELRHPLDQEKGVRILLMGHPYLVYDRYLNLDIIKKLEFLGGQVITMEMYDENLLRKKAKKLIKPMFWSYGTEAAGLSYLLLEEGGIDGIIYLTSFGCGIDSFVNYMMERRIKHGTDIPFFTITFDEHAAEAGIDTRIDAFMDTVKRSKENENNLSTYG